jgi:hypothetical protein
MIAAVDRQTARLVYNFYNLMEAGICLAVEEKLLPRARFVIIVNVGRSKEAWNGNEDASKIMENLKEDSSWDDQMEKIGSFG